MNVLIPMAGIGKRFADYGFKINKYLLPVAKDLTTMIEKAITTLHINVPCRYIFILREEVGEETAVRELLKTVCNRLNSDCVILSVSSLTEGPASSAYIAKDYINNNDPLIISNSDQILEWSFDNFMKAAGEADGCVLTYTPNYPIQIGATDKHSFVRKDSTGRCVEFKEKIALSTEALVGTHYYKQGRLFVEAYDQMVRENIRAPNGEFYISLTYDVMAGNGLNINTYNINTSNGECFYPVGEPGDYFTYYNTNVPMPCGKLSECLPIIPITEVKYLTIPKGFRKTIDYSFVIRLTGDKTVPAVFRSGKDCEIIANEDTLFLIAENIPGEYKIINPTDFIRGWMIGDFEPNIKRTTAYEVGLLTHEKGHSIPFHYHKYITEINFLIEGELLLSERKICTGDYFIFEQNVIACPIALEDCKVVCIKLPSVPSDKICI